MVHTHVVFGASGAIGSAIVRRLSADGERVRAVVRDPESARDLLPPSTAIVEGFAGDPGSTLAATRGATIIYHCVNVRYSRWTALFPGITENILQAAGEVGARLVFPGNVYPYGPFQQVPATEDHPRDATSKKGILRKEIEARLLEADRAGEVRVVIPRFPDFFGPNVTNPLFAPIFQNALAGKTATWPGRLDVPHDVIYIDDAAAAAVLLATTEDAYGQEWHVPGAGPLTGRQFLEMVFKATGTTPQTRALGRTMFRIFGILIPDAGEMVEMLYQFEQPMVLDGGKFARAFPSFRYTPHEEAVRRTVEWFRNPDVPGALAQ